MENETFWDIGVVKEKRSHFHFFRYLGPRFFLFVFVFKFHQHEQPSKIKINRGRGRADAGESGTSALIGHT